MGNKPENVLKICFGNTMLETLLEVWLKMFSKLEMLLKKIQKKKL